MKLKSKITGKLIDKPVKQKPVAPESTASRKQRRLHFKRTGEKIIGTNKPYKKAEISNN